MASLPLETGAASPHRPLRASHVSERLVDGELVLYDPTHQRVHALNPTASFVWQACDGSRDTEAIIESLVERYPGCRVDITEDVVELIRLFSKEGLLCT